MDLKTRPIDRCPFCGGHGKPAIEGALDHVTSLPGKWSFQRCQACSSLWQDPCPLPEEIGRLYPENYHFTHTPPGLGFSEQAGFAGSAKIALLARHYGYQQLVPRAASAPGFQLGKLAGALGLLRERTGRFIRFLPARPGGRLLDVGCGNGAFLSLMKELGWECDGVEPDPVAASVARSLGHHVTQGSVETLSLPANHYDAVTLAHVMEHFPDPHRALRAVARVLKPGGLFISISPNPCGWLSTRFGRAWYNLDAPRHLTIPSARGYRAVTEAVGLKSREWTNSRLTYWAFRESQSIAATGATGSSDAVLPSLLATLVTDLGLPLAPEMGEEVICVATKL